MLSFSDAQGIHVPRHKHYRIGLCKDGGVRSTILCLRPLLGTGIEVVGGQVINHLWKIRLNCPLFCSSFLSLSSLCNVTKIIVLFFLWSVGGLYKIIVV